MGTARKHDEPEGHSVRDGSYRHQRLLSTELWKLYDYEELPEQAEAWRK